MSVSRRPVIAGNWKMNRTIPEARELAAGIVRDAAGLPEADFILFPPFTALAEAARIIHGTAVGLGAQNLHWEEKGALTGEVSGPMLADAGCRFVLIGHSERRQFFGETDETVRRKAQAALKAGLRPVVCVGETLAERETGRTLEVISSQLETGLAGLSGEAFERLLLAYEPVWAIGTGRTATPAQAQEVQAAIRALIEEKIGKEGAHCVNILYGGSVQPVTSYALFRERDIDGFLIGGASLKAETFIEIGREAIRAYKDVN